MRWILIPFKEMEKIHVWVGVGRQFMDGSEFQKWGRRRERGSRLRLRWTKEYHVKFGPHVDFEIPTSKVGN